jgi:predicted metal-binding protein
MVQLAEDGSYSIGEMAIDSGSTYTAINGNDYTLTMDDEGMWSGAYIVVTEMVTLSTHGGTITLSRMEDGSYMYGEMMIEQGSVVMMNDRSYALTMDDEGMWSAMYVAGTQMVTLGDHGGTITLSRMEDGSYMYGEMMIEQGSVVMMNDRSYATETTR